MSENDESVDLAGIVEGFAPSEAYDRPEEDGILLGRLRTMLEHAAAFRQPYEQEWELAVQYAKGRQHRYRHKGTGEIIHTNGLLEKNKTSIHNVIRPTLRSLVGKLSALMPNFRTRPATMDREEIFGSKVADKFLEFFLEKESLNIQWLMAQEDVALFGNAVSQVLWDEDAGVEVSFCEFEDCGFIGDAEMIDTPCPNCEANIMEAQVANMEAAAIDAAAQGPQAIPEQQPPPQEAPLLYSAMTGDVKVRRHDPRRVFFQPGAESLEETDYVFVEISTTVSRLRMKFPELAKYITVEEPMEEHSFGQLGDESFGGGDFTSAGHDQYTADRTYYYEYHEVPTMEWPKGRVLYFTDSLILHEEASPYYKLFGRLPFYLQRWTVNPSELWGEGFITQAWHRQKELNTAETLNREWTESSTRIKWLLAHNSRINVDEFTAMSSQAMYYNAAAGLPQPITPPPMPSEVWQRRGVLTEDIRTLAGVTNAEAGISEASPNGRATALIEAANDQQIGPITTRNNEEWRQLNKALLVLAKERYSVERQFTIAGDDAYGETYEFADMQLSDGWDLILELEDGFSRNKAVRFSEAMELMSAQALGPPGGPDTTKHFAEIAKVKIPGLGPNMRDPDVANAREKLHKLEKGIPVDPFTPWDNPMICSEEFLQWLKGKGRQASPEIVQNVKEMWMFYTQWSMSMQSQDPNAEQIGPEQGNEMIAAGAFGSMPGTSTTAPGGSPSNSLNSLPGKGGGVEAEAGGMLEQADNAGELAAGQGNGQHEN